MVEVGAPMQLEAGQIVQVRSRQYLVEEVVPKAQQDTLVRLSCLEDDAQGDRLEVLWEREVDARMIGASSWEEVAQRGFDDPRRFSAYLHTLRWNCVTSTNPRLFQAPYRAGIEVKAYQLEPLRKALLLPRVNLFIADDVGLGKTIEAGLILRELLMRQKVRRVVVACPPSVVLQWRDEMESRFGLTFMVFDRDYVSARRRERGYGINAWTTHNRFILSHALLRDEAYAGPLRDWLGESCAGALLILDEAHNAAPASGSKYAIDSKLTRVVRDIAQRFEHRLFLSATPHNGHSNSFAALLEILDPQRFCRGVPVRSAKLLDAVMVRRLKQDIREVEGAHEFPARKVVKIVIDGLPEDAPELRLSRLLQDYRRLREARLQDASRSKQASAMLVITSLQKRLLSSIEAFARTLRVHSASMERQTTAKPEVDPESFSLLVEGPGADDDRAELSEDEVQAEEDAQVAAATEQAAASGPPAEQERSLLQQMAEIANKAKFATDPRVARLVDWIRANLCPELDRPGARWNDRRVLIFTEYTDTKRYLEEQLRSAVAGSDREHERIEVFHGGIGEERREAIKAAFNADPARHPLRILIATDAAREGVNLQNYCADLFHFDIPWNPSRMEQRNGRIDRKLQRSPEVRCHYFVLAQRAEDQVLGVLVRKTAVIQRELGCLTPVVEKKLSGLLSGGIRHDQIDKLEASIEAVAPKGGSSVAGAQVIEEELDTIRKRREKLSTELAELRELERTSKEWLGLDDRHFLDALSSALNMQGAEGLRPMDLSEAAKDPTTARWVFPALDRKEGADPTWAATLDTLRAPRRRDQKPWEWRREAPIRPVVFRDPKSLDGAVVHLHLEHRVVQRLLGRFLSQGFLHHELTRACVCLTDDPVPRILVLGRLSLYGGRAARLHDEVMAVAAEWSDPSIRGRGKLRPVGEAAKEDVLRLLEASLASPRLRDVPQGVRERLQGHAGQDVAELLPNLQKRAEELAERAKKKLAERGEKEAKEMRAILEQQRERIDRHKREKEGPSQLALSFDFSQFNQEELRQLEADRRHWDKRLQAIEVELVEEPERIRAAYGVQAVRVEPVGLVYLWPVSG